MANKIFSQSPDMKQEYCASIVRKEWLETLEKQALISTVERLCEVLRIISDQFDIVARHEDD